MKPFAQRLPLLRKRYVPTSFTPYRTWYEICATSLRTTSHNIKQLRCKMNNQQKVLTPRVIVQMLFFVVVLPLLPLLISWRWDWWEAWVYAFICIAGFAVSRLLVAQRHPDLLAERAQFMHHENVKPWDKLLAPLV